LSGLIQPARPIQIAESYLMYINFVMSERGKTVFAKMPGFPAFIFISISDEYGIPAAKPSGGYPPQAETGYSQGEFHAVCGNAACFATAENFYSVFVLDTQVLLSYTLWQSSYFKYRQRGL